VSGPDYHLEVYRKAKAGHRPSLTRLISTLEAGRPGLSGVLGAIHADAGRAHLVGLTGAPGSGKSSLVAALARQLRKRGRTVAIVAVDPSSALTGGALLGDRIRMDEHTLDQGVLVRSMSSRGSLGGLARATTDVVAVLDAAGWDYVFIETVGVGQAEVDIMRLADTVAVVSVPGLGDDIQAIKAGLLEIADIHVVNKSDLPGAQRTASELLGMLMMANAREGAWPVPVLSTDALAPGGIAELVDAFDDHRRWQEASGEGLARRRRRAAERIRVLARDRLMERLQDPSTSAAFDGLVDRVVDRSMSPHDAVDALFEAFTRPESLAGRK
jgi:LAO/AO transport system kinase